MTIVITIRLNPFPHTYNPVGFSNALPRWMDGKIRLAICIPSAISAYCLGFGLSVPKLRYRLPQIQVTSRRSTAETGRLGNEIVA